ncbi:protein-methionine-sulfoxide reductase catalytic subunit MsrP [Novimethylophilus kurashikiensis]|uniref:Protein-methionine-sulfoxide reductase catalytic subunit MsrP n=1 Tax=Novimethylophilus kurashikiensis TaxID=1825523 RepID=A0A2R5F561_9PROT|nr:molybdopterin-dependent oxidoreductase [Novimethylophilus kurashikiensis]GBG13079.1 protein-methionine-sulfoxide reductase catalytic subunit MsrP [Novimethylophilus kurashikiensis]
MLTRRKFLKGAADLLLVGAGASLVPRWVAATELPAGTIAASLLESLPGKRPLIKRTYRPINYETPIEYFSSVITPNDAFFVRWHLSQIPEIEDRAWRLDIGGEGVRQGMTLTLDQLKYEFEAAEITAVCQCAGNRRGLSNPHVPGVQWEKGAMGNAVWKGVRLKDVLARIGLDAKTVEIEFNGADTPAYEKTPDFVKSLPLDKALHEDTLIAYEMNGAPLPHLNGGPVRMVVPGWAATYWVKKVVSIAALTRPAKSFWMSPAYRIPRDMFPGVRFTSQEKEGDATTPVTELVVNTLIVNLKDGQKLARGETVTAQGIAWDSGNGIARVEVSQDGGRQWQLAQLGTDHGRYSFRQWTFAWKPEAAGTHSLSVRATNNAGHTQPLEPQFNPAGYHNNAVQRITVEVV